MTSKRSGYLLSVERLLGFASAVCSKLSDRRLAQYDLTLQQWVPLTALWRRSPVSESELAEYCRMSASSLNRLLDRMEAKDLVERSKDPDDRRCTLVELGRRGRRNRHLLAFFEEINAVLLAGMTKSERVQLVALLERVIENAERALSEDAGARR